MTWTQVYEPHGWHWLLSAVVAAIPVVLLLLSLTLLRQSAPRAAAIGAGAAILVAVLFIGMPWAMALKSFLLGAANGLLPIGWIVFAAMFLYQIAVDTGKFEIMKSSIAGLTADRRLQALMIAFSFGAIMEGAAGFGTPVAISAALLVGLGFRAFPAAVLCLIANTAPVAWGSIGIPIRTLASVSGLRVEDLSAMNGRILPITSVIVPLWLVRTMVPWKETLEVLPAILVSGISFAVTQFVWANHVDVGLVDIIAGAVSLLATAGFLKIWRPRTLWRFPEEAAAPEAKSHTRGQVFMAWLPFLVLFVFVVGWGVMRTNKRLAVDTRPWANRKIEVPGLHKQVKRVPPVERYEKAEEAIYEPKWISATGTGVMIACVVTALLLRQGFRPFGRSLVSTCRRMAMPLMAIVPMLGLAYVTRYSGTDAILGLAFTRTGVLYPFFGTFLGWLGVALTGSDTSSNVLFGNLQKVSAGALGLSPILTAATNSSGGVMGKMIDSQSIVVASVATNQQGEEGNILRYVFWHSLILACLVGVLVMLQAYVFPGVIPPYP
ncbi:MAG TPA: L-lactate permease [Planctomycetota bacterium]|nr:L-lactate permease [Planctomycetota bacterium]